MMFLKLGFVGKPEDHLPSRTPFFTKDQPVIVPIHHPLFTYKV